MKEVITEWVNTDKYNKEKYSTRWWGKSKDEVHKHVFQTVEMLETRQQFRTLNNIKYARLYSNLEILGVYAGIYTAPVNDYYLPNRLSLNVVKSCIDTVTSKIAKAKPRPLFLTEGGNWELQQTAKKLTAFMDGQADAINLHPEMQKSFRDGCVFGTGAVKFYPDKEAKTVKAERTIIEELLIDDADGIYGKPSVLFQRRLVNKQVLKEMFPDEADQIEMASNSLPSTMNSDMVKDLVKVIEAWHLPSGATAKDGMHVICVENCTLLCEEWTKTYFPFAFIRWSDKLTGFFGTGLAEELISIQLEINKILKNIQLSMHLFAVPRVFVENHSQVNLAGINNDIGALCKYTGNAPVFHTPQAMSPDVYQHLWNLVQKAYEITGVSQLSAASKKPEGLNSGVALREYQDIESDRFQIVGQRYEDAYITSAEIILDMMKDLSSEVKVSVKVSTDDGMELVNFKDVHMDENKYILRVFPTSVLPTEPAGKLQKITELVQAGFLDKDTAMDLLDFPDIKAATDKILAPRRVIIKTLDKIVSKGIYEAPEPYMKLDMAQAIAQQTYLNAKVQNVPEERLELLRNYIEDCKALMEIAQQGLMQQQQQAMAQMQPVAIPNKSPRSDVMPMNGMVDQQQPTGME